MDALPTWLTPFSNVSLRFTATSSVDAPVADADAAMSGVSMIGSDSI